MTIIGDFNADILYNPVMSVTRSVIKKLCLKQISERRYSVKFATCFLLLIIDLHEKSEVESS